MIAREYEYIWYGFPAFLLFCFGKYVGFLNHLSWWFILITFLIVIRRKK